MRTTDRSFRQGRYGDATEALRRRTAVPAVRTARSATHREVVRERLWATIRRAATRRDHSLDRRTGRQTPCVPQRYSSVTTLFRKSPPLTTVAVRRGARVPA